MKNPSNTHPQKGFTLVELLVVIAIIAVLAAAGFAGGTAAMNRARKVTAQAAATSVATAVEQFYTEYSALPDINNSVKTDGGDGVKLLNILAGLETGTTIQNDRKVRFLSLKEAKNGKDGLKFSADGKSIESLLDPWKQPYYVELDNEPGDNGYDEKITVSPGNGIPSSNLNGRRVAVYSLGVNSPGDAKPSTWVKTW